MKLLPHSWGSLFGVPVTALLNEAQAACLGGRPAPGAGVAPCPPRSGRGPRGSEAAGEDGRASRGAWEICMYIYIYMSIHLVYVYICIRMCVHMYVERNV